MTASLTVQDTANIIMQLWDSRKRSEKRWCKTGNCGAALEARGRGARRRIRRAHLGLKPLDDQARANLRTQTSTGLGKRHKIQ